MNSKPPKLSKDAKDHLMQTLTQELPVLRAKLGISQDHLSNIVGVSRQTYNAIEMEKRQMSWNTFLSLVLFFGFNEPTRLMLQNLGNFTDELSEHLRYSYR